MDFNTFHMYYMIITSSVITIISFYWAYDSIKSNKSAFVPIMIGCASPAWAIILFALAPAALIGVTLVGVPYYSIRKLAKLNSKERSNET